MFAWGWARVIVASLLLAAYGTADVMAGLRDRVARRPRPPRVRRPLWSHLLGFVSVVTFYGLIGRDGRAIGGGAVNQIGVLLCLAAVVLRLMARAHHGPVRHPDLSARLLLFAALPIVVGSPQSWIVFTLPQFVIAAVQAKQRESAIARSGQHLETRPGQRLLIPGVW